MDMYAIQTSKGDYAAFCEHSGSQYQLKGTPEPENAMLYTNLTMASFALNGFNSLGFTDLIIVQVEIN